MDHVHFAGSARWRLFIAFVCSKQAGAARFAAVVKYWEWPAYRRAGGLDFPGAGYRPGTEFPALVFHGHAIHLGAPYWGFRGGEWRVCQAHIAWPEGPGDSANSMRLRAGERARRAFQRFQRREFLSGGGAVLLSEYRAGPRLMIGLVEGGTAGGAEQDEPGEPLEMLLKTVRLPRPRLPEAARRRSSNGFVEELVRSRGSCPDVDRRRVCSSRTGAPA